MKKLSLLLLSILAFNFTYSQDEEEACFTITDKKVKKLFDQSFDKKLTPREQNQLLKDALAEDANCGPCIYELAKRAYEKAERDGTPFNYAEQYFKDLIAVCPKFHSDAYFFLAVFYYQREEFEEAIPYVKQFIDFKVTNDFQASADYGQKLLDLKEILPEIEFYATFFKNPVPFEPVVVANVSSAADEYLPLLSPDNELLFFTRRVDRKNLGDVTSRMVEEFSMATRPDINSPFDAGIKLPPPFNVAGDNFGGATISVDNKEMIFCGCKKNVSEKPTYNNCDLFSSKYERVLNVNTNKYEYKWSALENLGTNINTRLGWEAQPSLSADGKTLYYATTVGPEGEQHNDIYYSVKDANGNWTKGKPLPGVNTSGDEKAPFMHSDSKTLYFAARVDEERWGSGGYDIFYTRQLDDGTWSKAENIGYPINSKEDEHGLMVSTDGKLAYYGSNKLKGSNGFDIYYFELPERARPEKVVLVKGTVTDENGAAIENAKVEIKYSNSDKIEEIKVDPDNGKYVTIVNVEKGDAVITVKAEDHTMDSKLIASTTTETIIKNADMKAETIVVGKPYTLKDILFETASYELSSADNLVIDQFILFLESNPNIKVSINGHTDDEGNDQKNLELSKNRAKAVKEYIISKGISESRMASNGYGETKPKVPNTSAANQALNRRTEFIITGK